MTGCALKVHGKRGLLNQRHCSSEDIFRSKDNNLNQKQPGASEFPGGFRQCQYTPSASDSCFYSWIGETLTKEHHFESPDSIGIRGVLDEVVSIFSTRPNRKRWHLPICHTQCFSCYLQWGELRTVHLSRVHKPQLISTDLEWWDLPTHVSFLWFCTIEQSKAYDKILYTNVGKKKFKWSLRFAYGFKTSLCGIKFQFKILVFFFFSFTASAISSLTSAHDTDMSPGLRNRLEANEVVLHLYHTELDFPSNLVRLRLKQTKEFWDSCGASKTRALISVERCRSWTHRQCSMAEGICNDTTWLHKAPASVFHSLKHHNR